MSRPFAASLQRRAFSFLTLTILLSFLILNLPAWAQLADDPPSPLFIQPPFAQPKDRVTSFIDDEQRVTLRGNLHPLALAQYDAGVGAPDYSMQHMLLTLLPDATQQDVVGEA
jgi:hypothetical protein